METLPAEESRQKILLALYELAADQKSPHVDTDELEARADVGADFYNALRCMGKKGKGWLDWANRRVSITPAGEEKAEEIIKMKMAEKLRMVLHKIYDLGGNSHMGFVNISDLQRELDIPQDELISIINWAEKNTDWFDQNMEHAVIPKPKLKRMLSSYRI